MRYLHVLKRKKIIFLNIFLLSYVLINLFDGDRGFFSYLDKKMEKENLITKKENLTNTLKVVEKKNYLLSENLNFDYYDILIRQNLKFGLKNEIVIKINE